MAEGPYAFVLGTGWIDQDITGSRGFVNLSRGVVSEGGHKLHFVIYMSKVVPEPCVQQCSSVVGLA